MKQILFKVSTVLLLVFMIGFTSIISRTAHAAITTADIDEQRLVVKAELIDVLHEYVKFLQLTLIARLEQQVTALQARVDAQNK